MLYLQITVDQGLLKLIQIKTTNCRFNSDLNSCGLCQYVFVVLASLWLEHCITKNSCSAVYLGK